MVRGIERLNGLQVVVEEIQDKLVSPLVLFLDILVLQVGSGWLLASNPVETANSAHALKGAAALLGAEPIRRLTADIEATRCTPDVSVIASRAVQASR